MRASENDVRDSESIEGYREMGEDKIDSRGAENDEFVLRIRTELIDDIVHFGG